MLRALRQRLDAILGLTRAGSKRPRTKMHEERAQTALTASFSQVEAIVALYSSLDVRLPLPPMRGWAIRPDFACELVRQIARSRPANVLELGSGVSTLVTGYALSQHGGGKVLSVEHEAEWHRLVTGYVSDHGLTGVVEVVHAPLKDVAIDEERYPWYDCSRLPKGQLFDMLVVDGPPGRLHAKARYPALPLLIDLLSPHAVIVVDDVARRRDKAMVEEWKRQYGPFEIESPRTEKGMVVLRRRP